jgi:hypothetical protein
MAGIKARLWNRSDAHFHAEVNEKSYDIEARKFITMSLDEAVAVQGHYPGKGVLWPVEIERLGTEDQLQTFKCQRDGQTFGSQKELDKHLETHTDQVKGDDKLTCDKVWACVDCDREFPSKQQLKLHMRSHKEKVASVDTSAGVSNSNQSV